MKFYFFLFFEGDEAIVRTPFLKYGIIYGRVIIRRWRVADNNFS